MKFARSFQRWSFHVQLSLNKEHGIGIMDGRPGGGEGRGGRHPHQPRLQDVQQGVQVLAVGVLLCSQDFDTVYRGLVSLGNIIEEVADQMIDTKVLDLPLALIINPVLAKIKTYGQVVQRD